MEHQTLVDMSLLVLYSLMLVIITKIYYEGTKNQPKKRRRTIRSKSVNNVNIPVQS